MGTGDDREMGGGGRVTGMSAGWGGPRDAAHSHVTPPLLVLVPLRPATAPAPGAPTRLFSVLKMEGSMM